jgi:hypothetical protein
MSAANPAGNPALSAIRRVGNLAFATLVPAAFIARMRTPVQNSVPGR